MSRHTNTPVGSQYALVTPFVLDAASGLLFHGNDSAGVVGFADQGPLSEALTVTVPHQTRVFTYPAFVISRLHPVG